MMSPQACHQRQPLSQGSWLGPNGPPGGHCSRLLITSRALCQDLGIVTSIWVYTHDTQSRTLAGYQLELETSESCCQTLSAWVWWVSGTVSTISYPTSGTHRIRHQYMPVLYSISYEISYDIWPDINICRYCLRYRTRYRIKTYDIGSQRGFFYTIS